MAEDKKHSGWRAIRTVDIGEFPGFQSPLCCCRACRRLPPLSSHLPVSAWRFDSWKACFERADRLCSSKNLDQRITGKERNECGHQNESLPRHFSSFGLPRTFFRPWTEEGRSQVWFVPVSGALEANHTVCSNATYLICMRSKREHGLSQTFETFFLSWRSAGP